MVTSYATRYLHWREFIQFLCLKFPCLISLCNWSDFNSPFVHVDWFSISLPSIDCKSFVMVMMLICNWNVWKRVFLCVWLGFSFIKPQWLMVTLDHRLFTYLVFILLQVLRLKWIQLLKFEHVLFDIGQEQYSFSE